MNRLISTFFYGLILGVVCLQFGLEFWQSLSIYFLSFFFAVLYSHLEHQIQASEALDWWIKQGLPLPPETLATFHQCPEIIKQRVKKMR